MKANSILEHPEVKKYRKAIEKEYQQKYRNNFVLFKKFHAFGLIFQSSALKQINQKFNISKTDFIVLSACFLVVRSSWNEWFTTPQIKELLIGVYWCDVYKSVRHLQEKELIIKTANKGRTRFFDITPKGLVCIKSYSGYYGWHYHKYGKKTKNLNISLPQYMAASMKW